MAARLGEVRALTAGDPALRAVVERIHRLVLAPPVAKS